MKKKAIRVGLVGVGWHAKSVILPALMHIDSLKLVCACTSREQTAAAVEDTYRLKCYVGYEQMLEDADIDAVIAVGGDQQQTMIRCLKAGKHVFSETPGIKTLDGTEKIIKLCRENNEVALIGRCLRFSPICKKMKNVLERWRKEDISERMFMVRYYMGIEHVMDLLLFLNGPVEKLLVHGANMQRIISLGFANGDIGVVIARGFNNNTPEYEMIEVSSTGGVLRATNGSNLMFHRTAKPIIPRDDGFNVDAASYEGNLANLSFPYAGMKQLHVRGYIPELEFFASLINSQDNGLYAAEDIKQLLSIKKAMAESEKTKNWVNCR